MSRAKRLINAASEYIPDAIETPLRRAFGVPRTPPKKAKSLVVPRPASKPLALPAPPKPLALPAPGPGLPSFAAKQRGGQWFVDKNIGGRKASDLGVKVVQMPGDDGRWIVMNDKTPMIFDREDEARAQAQSLVDQANPNRSPENAARRIADNSLRLARDASGPLSQLQDWFLRAAPRYIKNEMGTPDDPMRALAERGGLHVEMSPDEWSEAASSVISREPIGSALGIDQLYTPAGSDPRAGYDYGATLAVNMPWLKKAPVTDELYGIGDTYALQDKMGMSHLLDEMRNAMDPRSGLPSELAVRPESLGRMGLAQAAERVGLINQFRVKEMERAALSNMDSPAVQTFKEYADDNPMGLRWTELRSPGDNAPLPEGWMPDGKAFYNDNTGESQLAHPSLQDALKYEGDTMGHCVGGYCDDVASGRSRIFSLRDAKGEPHVTIETRPRSFMFSDVKNAVGEETANQWLKEFIGQEGALKSMVERAGLSGSAPEDIIQIKGKQNRAPKDDYLPFVQDFVKSGQWGNIGDLRNTNLVRLPDGRYLDNSVVKARLEQRAKDRGNYNPEYWDRERDKYHNGLDPEQWDQFKDYFEGYAIGGRVDADRCFSYNPLTVRRGR